MPSLTLVHPDDWHLHLRDGDILARDAPDTALRFASAIVIQPRFPGAHSGRGVRLIRAHPGDTAGIDVLRATNDTFTPSDHTSPEEIARAKACGIVCGVGEVFLAGTTTNSAFGVSDFARCEAAFAVMEEAGLPLRLHGRDGNAEVHRMNAVHTCRKCLKKWRRYALRFSGHHKARLQCTPCCKHLP